MLHEIENVVFPNGDFYEPTFIPSHNKILVKKGDGAFEKAHESHVYFLLHSVANYAIAKKESQNLKSVFKTMKGDAQSTLHQLLVQYVPQITPEETNALFEAIDKDGLI